MQPGDKLRFIGPNGAPFVVTVSSAWTPAAIRARVEAGEWTPVAEQGPASAPAGAQGDGVQAPSLPEPPALKASKGEHLAYATEVLGLAAADVEGLTKMDLADVIAEERAKRAQ